METKNSTSLGHGIRQEANGTYTIDCVKTVHGQRIHIYSSGYQTYEEALSNRPRLIENRTSRHSPNSAVKTNVRDFLKEYEDYRRLHVRQSTVAFGKSAVRLFFLDKGDMPLSDAFRYETMRNTYREILDHPGTPEWKNRVFGTFRHMAETAFKWRYLTAAAYQDVVSIFENIPENRGAKKERPIWTLKERSLFLSVIKDPEDVVLFELFFALGARIGEFAGLTWDCFDPRRGTIEIKQQLVYQNEGRWVLSPLLKTQESYRICRLPKRVADMLRDYGKYRDKTGFLFYSKEKKDYPMSKATIRRKFYSYGKAAGLKRITPHCIRHSKATDLMRVCKDMEEVKAAARFLGHSATIMVDTYGHGSEQATNAVLRRLERDDALFH